MLVGKLAEWTENVAQIGFGFVYAAKTGRR
jgi:hypothetical protein